MVVKQSFAWTFVANALNKTPAKFHFPYKTNYLCKVTTTSNYQNSNTKLTTSNTLPSLPHVSRRWLMIALASMIASQKVQALAEDEAIENFRKVTGLQNLAFELTNQQKFSEAEVIWTKIILLNDNNAAAYSNRGNSRTSQGKFEQAIIDFDKAISLAPDEPDPYLGKGVAMEGIEKYQDALDAYFTCNQLSINKFKSADPIALNNIGNAYGALGKWESACDYFQKASKLDTRFVFALANESLALYQLGREDEASRKIRFLLRKYPGFSDMHAVNAMLLWNSGRKLDAETEWYKAIQSDNRYEDFAWVKNVRRWPPRLLSSLEDFRQIAKMGA